MQAGNKGVFHVSWWIIFLLAFCLRISWSVQKGFTWATMLLEATGSTNVTVIEDRGLGNWCGMASMVRGICGIGLGRDWKE